MLRLTEEDGRIWLVYLRVTDTQFLEIFPEGTGETPSREQMGVTHLCWEVDDMDAALAELEERGVPITTPVRRGRTGNLQAWITDPEGNRVELMWMDPNGMTLRAVERLQRGEGPFPPERR
jgi:lactoylglutathione lyase